MKEYQQKLTEMQSVIFKMEKSNSSLEEWNDLILKLKSLTNSVELLEEVIQFRKRNK